MKIFAGGQRGSHVGFVANAAVLVAVAAVAVAMLLDRATKGPNAPLVALFAPNATQSAPFGRNPSLREAILPRFDRVDTMSTASIRGPIVLDPCLGHAK